MPGRVSLISEISSVSTNIGIRSVYLFSLQLPVGASGGRGSGGEHCHLGTIIIRWIIFQDTLHMIVVFLLCYSVCPLQYMLVTSAWLLFFFLFQE